MIVTEGHYADVVVGRSLLHHSRDVEVAPAVDDAVVNLESERRACGNEFRSAEKSNTVEDNSVSGYNVFPM